MSSTTGLTLAESSCCKSSAAGISEIHQELAGLLRKYDVNQFAASVQVYAVKPA
jgi:hypothetical protein